MVKSHGTVLVVNGREVNWNTVLEIPFGDIC